MRTVSGKVAASTDPDRPPALGPAGAPVLVIVLSDFQCPVCRRAADATRQIPEEFPGDVRVEFWQHPLAMHPNARGAARAAIAAQRQGRFWDYHDELFRDQSALDPAGLASTAARLGLDVARFDRDRAAPELDARIDRESALAETLGARGTPAFLVNGALAVGWGSWSGFRGAVERELIEARKLIETGVPRDAVAARRAEAAIKDPGSWSLYRSLVVDAPQPPAAPPAGKKDPKKSKHSR